MTIRCPAWCTTDQFDDETRMHRRVVYDGDVRVTLEEFWHRPDHPYGPWRRAESGVWLQLPPGDVVGGQMLTTAEAIEVARALRDAAEMHGGAGHGAGR